MTSTGNYMFVMVGKDDIPVYESEFFNSSTQRREDTSHLNQFIIHAALDMVDDLVWGTQNMYLKCVDKFNDYFISAFVTAGHIKLMLLHDVRNDDGIRNFFQEVYELYVRVLMNPFYEPSAQITSTFDARVKLLGRKYF
uniref:Trafficking protein particle complex subunit n=1 Tax=Chrysotila carterae TaxID=13221 RepID=A0A7S4C1V6_CHRCT|mmetsp:Transcript_43136/g.94460  ORF Transcript_43136/g.94460 Transcript_43136/m.94460 type:complete len:139 (+) Transcript_43136:367-783(+)